MQEFKQFPISWLYPQLYFAASIKDFEDSKAQAYLTESRLPHLRRFRGTALVVFQNIRYVQRITEHDESEDDITFLLSDSTGNTEVRPNDETLHDLELGIIREAGKVASMYAPTQGMKDRLLLQESFADLLSLGVAHSEVLHSGDRLALCAVTYNKETLPQICVFKRYGPAQASRHPAPSLREVLATVRAGR